MGILNGLLPCGFVYVAMTAAAVNLGRMLFMAGYGFGTFPATVGSMISPLPLSADFRARIVKMLPAFTLLVGILLVIRGLNLGISFNSPKLSSPTSIETMRSHH